MMLAKARKNDSLYLPLAGKVAILSRNAGSVKIMRFGQSEALKLM